MEKINLTAVIIAKNEGSIISKAISSVPFCNEILVADDSSNDDTVRISEGAGAKVFRLPAGLSFSAKRTLALEKASNDWILFVDSDEVVTPELAEEIIGLWKPGTKKTDAYSLRRRDFWWGTELKFGETRRARTGGICRLVNRNKGRWSGQVHEIWKCDGQTVTLSGYLNHYPHPSLKDFIADINSYSTLRAQELHKAGVHPDIMQTIFFPLGKFMLTYFLYLGFLDGPAGFAYSFLMSFHSFLVRAKLYQYGKLNTSL